MIASVEMNSSQRTLTLINNERAQEGLSPLKWNEHLAEASQRHAQLLARNRQLSHRFPDEAPLQQRLADVGLRFERAGENVAVNYNAEGAHLAFMHSPGHRANILNTSYDEVGVAVVNDGDLLYVVEDFTQQRTISSSADAVRGLAKRFEDLGKAADVPHLEQVQDARVQDWACAVAQDPSTAAQAAAPLGAKFVLAFSAAEADAFPGEIGWLRRAQAGDRYALGVCFSRTPRYPAGRYFVTIALFAPDKPLPVGEQSAALADSSLADMLPSLDGGKPGCKAQSGTCVQ